MTGRDIPGLDAMLYAEAARLAGHSVTAQGEGISEALALGLWAAFCVVVGALVVAWLVGRK